jgi:hypothetical protein
MDHPEAVPGRGRGAWGAVVLLAALSFSALGGCATVRVTDPQRTATEQMLLSEAAEEAVNQLSTQQLKDREVYVDSQYFSSVDSSYVIGELRAHLLQQGVRLMGDRTEAKVIVEVRSGGVGIDKYNYLLGLPPIFLPATDSVGGAELGGGTVITPELALIKRIRQLGFASVAFVAYWKDTGEVLASSGPFVGRTRREDWWFFGWGPTTQGNIAPAERTD